MIPLDQLQADQAAFTQILQARRGVPQDDMRAGERILWQIYLTILEDALTTLTSLIQYLSPKMEGATPAQDSSPHLT